MPDDGGDERAELYGRLGFLQARVQDLEQEIRLLTAPTKNGDTMSPLTSAQLAPKLDQANDPAPPPR